MQPTKVIKILQWLIFGIVFLVPLFYVRQSVYPYTFAKTLFFQALVEIAFFLWLALAVKDQRLRPRFTPITLAVGGFLLVAATTAFFGVDFWRSLWSTQERMVGIITFLHLAVFMLVVSSLREHISRQWLLFTSVLTADIVSFLAFLQLNVPNLLLTESVGSRPGATFGNPTFFAGYLLFHIFIALYYFLFEKNAPSSASWYKWFFGGSFVCLSIALFITQTRGDILGFGLGILTLFFLFALQPPLSSGIGARRSFYFGCLGIFVLIVSGFWLTRSASVWKGVPGLERFQNLTFSSSEIEPRLFAYRAAWQGFLERPTGWGWENFNVVSNKYYQPSLLQYNYVETRFDKPHNVFLEYLVTGGALLLLAYCAMLIVLIKQAWRKDDLLFGQIVVAIVVSYSVRNLFVFETLGPLLILFLLLGLVDGAYRRGSENTTARPKGNSRGAHSFSSPWPGLVVGLMVAYGMFVIPLQATYHQFWGFHLFIRNQSQKAVESFEKAIALPTPYRWNIQRDYAAAITQAYFYNPTSVSVEAVRRAIKGMEEVAEKHPLDAYNHYALVDMYNEASDADPQYLSKAEKQAEIALSLSPNRQQVLFSLAKTKTLKKENLVALDILKKALDLEPKVPDAHFYYGLLAHVVGQKDLAYKELKEAIAMGRQWKNVNEPILVGNFFADQGHLSDAIMAYKQAGLMDPENLEVMAKLGVAYYFAGDRDLARIELQKLKNKTDLRSSPGYADMAPILRALGLE